MGKGLNLSSHFENERTDYRKTIVLNPVEVAVINFYYSQFWEVGFILIAFVFVLYQCHNVPTIGYQGV